jgi:hypothetical protein
MLYLISNPMFLSAGNYAFNHIMSEEAVALIRHTHSTNKLKSLVHFASTMAALRVLADVEVALVGRSEIPTPKDGDCFIDIRLKCQYAERSTNRSRGA